MSLPAASAVPYPVASLKPAVWRLVGGGLCAALGLWVWSFVSRPEHSLGWLTQPWAVAFFLLGLLRPYRAGLLWLLLLAAVPLVPFLLGVPNFSLVELGLFSAVAGFCGRTAVVGPRAVSQIGFAQASAGLVWAFPLCVAVLMSVLLQTSRNFHFGDPLLFESLGNRLSGVFVPDHGSRFHYLRSALTLLEGPAILFLVLAWRRIPLEEPVLEDVRQSRSWIIFAVSGAALAVHGLLQYLVGFGLLEFWAQQEEAVRRINGTWPDVNSCGAYFAAVLFPAIAVTARWRGIRRVLMAVSVVFILLAIAASGSRSAAQGVVIGALVWGGLSLKSAGRLSWFRLPRFSRGLAVLIAAAVVTASSCVLVFLDPDSEIWASLHSSENSVNRLLKGRLNIWRSALLLWGENPFFGTGVGSVYQSLGRYYDPALAFWNPVTENAHNYFLQLGAELGWLGLLPWLLIVGGVLRLAVRHSALPAGRWSFERAGVCAVAALLVTCLTGNTLLVPEMNFIFWGMLGLLYPVGGGVKTEHRRGSHLVLAWLVLAGGAAAGQIALENPARRIAPDLVGFHEVQRDGREGFFRWTRGRARVTFLAPDATAVVRLRNVFAPGQPRQVTIRAGGQTVLDEILNTPDWLIRTLSLPAPGLTTLEVRVAPFESSSPALRKKDPRELGVMFSLPGVEGFLLK